MNVKMWKIMIARRHGDQHHLAVLFQCMQSMQLQVEALNDDETKGSVI